MEALILCGRCLAFVMKNEKYGQGECHRRAPVPAERDDVLWPKRLASEPGCFEAILSAQRHDKKIEPVNIDIQSVLAEAKPDPKTKDEADKGW